MNTQEFFDLILPNEGYRVIVSHKQQGGIKTFYLQNNLAAARCVEHCNTCNDTAVFHACATYKTDQNRKAENVLAVKAFWLDVDCGPGKPYADQDAALAAIELFRKQLRLWDPCIVKSGNGLHVYWPLEQSVEPERWIVTAQLLKVVCVRVGLSVGVERTADIASVLRPVGSYHRKNPADPKLVHCIEAGSVGPYEWFHERLSEYAHEHGLDPENDLGARPAYVAQLPMHENLHVEDQYEPVTVDALVEGCAHVKMFRDTGCNKSSEPHWRALIGVVKHCVDGEATCHEWSQLDKRYQYAETQSKIDGWTVGPASCNTLQSHRPDLCKGCPFAGKIKTPMAAARQTQPAAPVAPQLPTPQLNTLPVPNTFTYNPRTQLPPGYTWKPNNAGTQGMLMCDVPDKQGVVHQISFGDVELYPIAKYDTNDGVVLRMRAHVKPTLTRDFDLPAELVASPNDLLKRLARNEVVPLNKNGAMMVGYISAWVSHLRVQMDALKTYDQFGWTDDRCFIIGDTMLKPDGTEEQIVLNSKIRKLAADFVPKGSLDVWKKNLDRAYNHPGLEGLQFAVMSGFAAPLVRMFTDIGGITVYMHSDDSGKGKTTAERVALSIFSNWRQLQMTNNAATINAVFAMLGTVSNMPLVIDEMTNMDNATVGNMIYLISLGDPKKRCDTSGGLDIRDSRWETIIVASGNSLLSEKVAQHRAHSEGERARIFEYSLDIRSSPIKPTEALALFPQFSENYGHAGRVFMRYVVDNYDDVKARLYANQTLLSDKFNITQTERYWAVLLACVMTAHEIALKLGLVAFPMSPLLRWVRSTLTDNRGGMKAAGVNQLELFSRMLGDLWKDFIVSQGEGKIYGGSEPFVDQHPRAAVHGRVITQRVGIAGNNDPTAVYVSSSAIKVWCNKHGVTAKEMFKAVTNAGLVLPKEKIYNLGTGIRQYKDVGRVACWVLVPTAPLVVNAVPALPALQATQAGP